MCVYVCGWEGGTESLFLCRVLGPQICSRINSISIYFKEGEGGGGSKKIAVRM